MHIISFIFLQLVATYTWLVMKKIYSIVKIQYHRMVAVFITANFRIFALTHYKEWDESFSQNYFEYNNPFIIFSSIFLFMPFSTMKIKSEKINLLAKGVFGIFLLHITSIFIYYRTTIIGSLYQEYGYLVIFISAIIIFIICCFISLITEKAKTPLYNFIKTKLK